MPAQNVAGSMISEAEGVARDGEAGVAEIGAGERRMSVAIHSNDAT